MKKKCAIIIGSGGQLGTALIDASTAFGYTIIAYDKTELDITDSDSLHRRIDEIAPHVVINASAYHVLRDCEDHPDMAYAVNALAVSALASICRQKGIRFVTYSTDYVFDGTKGSPYTEDDHPRPLQVYGASKVAGEYGAQHTYAQGTLIVRTCGLYGGIKGSPMKGGNFVINILKEAKGKEYIKVSGDQIVSPTSGRDLAYATYELLDHESAVGIYHLVNEGMCSWYEFAEEIFRIAGVATRVLPVARGQEKASTAPARPAFSALTNTRAKALGITLPAWQKSVAHYLHEIML